MASRHLERRTRSSWKYAGTGVTLARPQHLSFFLSPLRSFPSFTVTCQGDVRGGGAQQQVIEAQQGADVLRGQVGATRAVAMMVTVRCDDGHGKKKNKSNYQWK